MDRKLILTALASAAILCGGQALAAGPGGGGGGGHGGGNSGGHGSGNMGGDHGAGMGNAGMGRGDNDDMGAAAGGMDRGDGRINSEGPEHASPNGIAHADDHSVLAGTTVATSITTGALAGVADGQAVFFNGMQVGTVQQIRLAGTNVAFVLVKASNGAIFPVPANKLSLVNGVLSTTARFRGVDDNDMADRDRH